MYYGIAGDLRRPAGQKAGFGAADSWLAAARLVVAVPRVPAGVQEREGGRPGCRGRRETGRRTSLGGSLRLWPRGGANRHSRSVRNMFNELVVCKNVGFSLRAFDAVKDLVGVLGPGEGDRVVVPVVDVRADRRYEFLD